MASLVTSCSATCIPSTICCTIHTSRPSIEFAVQIAKSLLKFTLRWATGFVDLRLKQLDVTKEESTIGTTSVGATALLLGAARLEGIDVVLFKQCWVNRCSRCMLTG